MLDLNLAPRSKTISAILDLPGSKSIANRVLPIAAIAKGTSIISNVPLVSEDVNLMLDGLKHLGIKIKQIELSNDNTYASYAIEGCNLQFPNTNVTLFCGNSGTTIRFLGAILGLNSYVNNCVLTGIERMKERPIGDLVDALNSIGAQIKYQENIGYPPLLINSFKDTKNGVVKISGKVSSQYITGLLIGLSTFNRNVVLEITDHLISKPYVDMTVNLLSKFGALINSLDNSYQVLGKGELIATNYSVEPDASSASYFLALGAINGEITVNNLSLNSLQGDKNFAKVLEKMGAVVTYNSNSITVKSQGKLNAIDIDMEDMPDVAMTIAVLALFANGVTMISGISSWKVKETDRLNAMYTELIKLGAKVTITDSSITIDPPNNINPNMAIDTYNDHRMAMCFSLVAAYGVSITINDYRCVGKTFANYFDLFNQLCY